MATLNESTHPGEYIVSEANGSRSREAGFLASGNDLGACAVLGQVTTASAATAGGGNTGNGTASAPTVGTEAINGTYTLTCTAAAADSGTFSVVTPLGAALDDLTVAVAYVSSHINLTISDGATDFIVGDTFTVDVIFSEYGEFNAGASDGTEVAKAILFSAVDATSAEQKCVVTARDSEVRASDLVWKTGTTESQKATAIASLASVGIILR